ncbi:hypothetical protein H6P81_012906 [Aristolochia fimbriata]|uniref:Uncharacterized protein n=1 Tax=Aristolochia fimbriata TaxID=158543 RepID=A0AAV7EHT2_ARIFI|nr:hypothetical protein H6P81_012906 [Aristolochia fimbriata]
MQDTIPLPACFSSGGGGEKTMEDGAVVVATKSGQSMVMSVYQTKIAGQCRSITVTWCKNLLVHGLSISVEGRGDGDGDGEGDTQYACKVELKPWYFWRKQGCKRFSIDGTAVDVFWDLKAAKFGGDPEPVSDYYVAMVCEAEVALLLGDLKKEAYRKTGARPSLIDAILLSKKEHIFGKKKFSTRARFQERGKLHEISIECSNSSNNGGGAEVNDPEMAIRVDGHLAVQVKHLQWKFRGNESISINKVRIEVYWDVHDWLFSPGLRHALFIFKPISSAISSPLSSSASSSISTPSSQTTTLSGSMLEGINGTGSSGFCLFVYAWKESRPKRITFTGRQKWKKRREEKRRSPPPPPLTKNGCRRVCSSWNCRTKLDTPH